MKIVIISIMVIILVTILVTVYLSLKNHSKESLAHSARDTNRLHKPVYINPKIDKTLSPYFNPAQKLANDCVYKYTSQVRESPSFYNIMYPINLPEVDYGGGEVDCKWCTQYIQPP